MEFSIKSNGTALDLYNIGEEFRLAACRCFGQKEGDSYTSIKDSKMIILYSATVVNAAFACEMYLKALIKHNGIESSHTHRLDVLFKKLPMDIQEQVGGFCSNNNMASFIDVLERNARAFTDARYYVENNKSYEMSPTFFFVLAWNLSQITRTLIDGKNN